MMSNFWDERATKLQAELQTAGIELNSADDVIAASAGDWFAVMGPNTKTAVIATMRNLASSPEKRQNIETEI